MLPLTYAYGNEGLTETRNQGAGPPRWISDVKMSDVKIVGLKLGICYSDFEFRFSDFPWNLEIGYWDLMS